MRKEFEFTVKGHKIKIVNSWFGGAILYVDGDFRDQDSTFIANGKTALLSAKLADFGILEIFPISALISVEMDAFLITDDERLQVYRSHKRLTLAQQRLAK
ncbi:hypothetical protein LOC50_04865 [Pseudoalteromonas sp. SCSIO 43095]|uniref:hypothetical protein n=1 Tax=unclassified Pseudoalteromonas TaxID=194690 RepID=UPI00044BA25F|nr:MULTISPECIES: hypothetical protein [unclassified Pseudoalteromonas]EWS97386.1 hypothetical protein BG00_12995 [Pseudoalteromonas sp. SCSIO_11900]URQ99619.1 hypothetical protein LOC50_04865 [Pseudoalteromonas sp. SCSIO 43095]